MSVVASISLKKSGFTIVELLIVIVVIAILAAISVVAYTGIQARANDSKMINGVAQIEKAMKLYAVNNSSTITGGWGSTTAAGVNGCVDGGEGFFATGNYTCTAEETLIAAGFLPAGFTSSLPNNTYFGSTTSGLSSIMLYSCGATGRYGLYWTLRSPTATDSSNINSTLSTCSHTTNIRDSWGMRSGKIIQL